MSAVQTHGECALCGHWLVARDGEVLPRCGVAEAMWNGAPVGLCHADDHSCYKRWTVDGERPDIPASEGEDMIG